MALAVRLLKNLCFVDAQSRSDGEVVIAERYNLVCGSVEPRPCAFAPRGLVDAHFFGVECVGAVHIVVFPNYCSTRFLLVWMVGRVSADFCNGVDESRVNVVDCCCDLGSGPR